MLYHSVTRVAIYLYKNEVEEVSFFIREKLLYDPHELGNLELYVYFYLHVLVSSRTSPVQYVWPGPGRDSIAL